MTLGAAAISSVVAVIAIVVASVAWNDSRELASELAAARQSITTLETQQNEIASAISAVSGDVSELQAATGESLASYLAGLESAVSQAQRDADNAMATADSNAFRTDQLVSCVNEYMKVVADSGGGYYRFYFCQ